MVSAMPNDDERREVARRLRGNPENTLIPHRTGRHHGMGCHEAADRFWNMCDRIKAAGNYDIAFSTTFVLADLIEPGEPKVECVAEVKVDGELLEKLAHDTAVELIGIDRDALLALADEIELDGAGALDDGDWCKPLLIEYAHRIREACVEVPDGK